MDPLNKIDERLKRIESQLNILLSKGTEPEKPLTIAETAVFLGLTVSAVYCKINRKQIPYYKESPNSKPYFFKSELVKYIKGFRQMTTEEFKSKSKKLK